MNRRAFFFLVFSKKITFLPCFFVQCVLKYYYIFEKGVQHMKNKKTIVILIALLVTVAAIVAGVLFATRDGCNHVYGYVTLHGTPTYEVPVDATRICELCQQTQTLSVYAADLPYEIDDDGICSIVDTGNFNGKVLYIASKAKDGTPIDAIGDSVFWEKSFDALYLEEGITRLDNYAFAFNSALKQISLPASLRSYGEYTFSGCQNLSEVVLAEGSTVLGPGQFYECTALTEIALPDTITEILHSAFLGCSSLERVTLPKHLQLIGSHAFSGCTKLFEIDLPTNLKELFPDCFAGCISLTYVKLPALDKLSYNAFLGCSGLKGVYLPKEIKEIGVNGADGPFYGTSEHLVLYTDAQARPDGWSEHFENFDSAVADDDGGELDDDAYFHLKVVYNCAPADFPGN